MALKMTDEYFEYVFKYQKLYGNMTVVLLQNGSFFEMYGIDNESEKCFPEIRIVCDTLDIFLSRKNKSIQENGRHNPLMAGFPIWSYQKHIQTLLDNEYTVVIFEQKEITSNKGEIKFERILSEVLSPSIQLEYHNVKESQYCFCIYLSKGTEYFSKLEFWNVAVSMIEISTGKIYLYDISHSRIEKKESVIFDLIRLLKTHNPSELIFVDETENIEQYWRKELNYYHTLHYIHPNQLGKIFDKEVSIEKIKKKIYQEEFFKKIYSNKNLNSNLNIIEYLHLESSEIMRISCMILLQFVWNHNRFLLENLQKPEWCECIGEKKPSFCKIENNSMEQIGLFYMNTNKQKRNMNCQYMCVFDVINKTKTPMGHRFLRETLAKPLINVSDIIDRQKNIQYMIRNQDLLMDLRTNLEKISDTERIHRKIQMGNISCMEFTQLQMSYMTIECELKKWSTIFGQKNLLSEMIDFINKHLLIENCGNISRNQDIETQIFRQGTYIDLDQLINEKEICISYIEKQRKDFENILSNKTETSSNEDKVIRKSGKISKAKSNSKSKNKKTTELMLQILKEKENFNLNDVPNQVKCEYSDKDKYHFVITNTKFKTFQEIAKKNKLLCEKYTTKVQASNVKVFCEEMNDINKKLSEISEKINELSKKYFALFVKSFCNAFESQFTLINKSVALLDFYHSGAIVAIENNYTCPNCVESDRSFIDCKDLRHPLIEKILMYSMYVPNDICLGKENDSTNGSHCSNGYLIFGTNSCGKSVFMKSVGIATIIAQVGYFVPCTKMTFSPFHNIITRMSGNDDPLRGQSSFAVEMIELNLIISRSNQNSLVLGDEICHGTEHVSGVSLMASSIIYLCERRVPFVFASHLHQLSKMDVIQDCKGLSIKHLTVKRDIENNQLIYERTLKDGSGEATYGIEVAKYIIENQEFIRTAEKIQKIIKEEELNVVSERVSKYNRHKIIDRCQICGNKATETHHIIPQKDADEKGMIKLNGNFTISKDHYTNLVALCEKCHLSTHGKKGKKLDILGYIETTNGLELKFNWTKK